MDQEAFNLGILKAPAPSFDEPLEMLAACHERIEAQLGTLERLVRHLPRRGCDADARAAAAAVLRYFDTAGMLHHQDEDRDLFPLLRARAAARGRAGIAAATEELEREHATIESQWRRLRRRLLAIGEGEGRLDPEEVARFAWLQRRHIDRETAALLPFAREALEASDRADLGMRMAARRTAAARQ
ncbi:MAG TPA: hemerythrin domain-containing protein [Steroidobacteraceae bacterium]|nr:hemerythrin domain-containing protein [Steroidobacteraceae bacterium]